MGFDVYGVKPKNTKGEYFRNNVWYWRPLWALVIDTCGDILTNQDAERGSYNDGHTIPATKAYLVGQRLLEIANNKEKMKEYKAKMNKITGESSKAFHKAWTQAELEKNPDYQPRKWENPYKNLLTKENVKEFAEFCLASGGFQIY